MYAFVKLLIWTVGLASSDVETMVIFLKSKAKSINQNYALPATIAARTFAQVCLYDAGDDLLLGMTTQLHAFRQCVRIRSRSVAYKVFENYMRVSFVFSPGSHNGISETG
ncbi:hypothetical protein TNCV_4152031 [Trichonephila clavipes]|nr:hypothetical protein TNCV_4152031 [Trichonephila clavipes]